MGNGQDYMCYSQSKEAKLNNNSQHNRTNQRNNNNKKPQCTMSNYNKRKKENYQKKEKENQGFDNKESVGIVKQGTHEQQKQLSKYKDKLEQLEQKKDEQIRSIKNQISEFQKDMNSKQQQINKLKYLLENKNREVQQKDNNNQKLIESNRKIEKELEQKNKQVQDILRETKQREIMYQKKVEDFKQKNLNLERQIEDIRFEKRKQLEKTINKMEEVKQQLNSKIQRVQKENQQLKQTISSMRNYSQYFNGDILNTHNGDYTQWLVAHLEKMYKKIVKTKFLYRFDTQNPTSFHKYIDEQPFIVIFVKLKNGNIDGGFSEEPFKRYHSTENKPGFLFNLNKKQHFQLKDQRYTQDNVAPSPIICNDDYIIMFGNAELRIKFRQNFVYSNFGANAGYFNSKGLFVRDFLGEDAQNTKQADFITYELFSIVFQK